ncbi:DNA-3-methyladenine glycosylase [Paeniglutamicibacter cryotolerans]|uniref:Putative 3-methyladenine DNA glycosylase n=1 Tax=Paeniglutamicibacter cryotolerans TaxID=670079 RepID=A0A839QKX1_9MICC|nr:DNA-3-methyladenine glycosylase [Paeniglutamicibacter cryotolerans]MBB2996263.1 DNA-3-methyladenine glycosylase [Paeniglutamicibacter cryotolerans]
MGASGFGLLGDGATIVAPRLLGAVLRVSLDGTSVAVRLTEVEAYEGALDPGSHGYRGKTARNAALFGPPGTLYVYFTYGMHFCASIVCGTDGNSSACLMRGGEVIEGRDVAVARRGAIPRTARDLASGPARLTQCLGLRVEHSGARLEPMGLADSSAPGPHFELGSLSATPLEHHAGPRVGVAGEGGTAAYPWRFWLPGEDSVSTYRPATVRGARR